MDLALLVYGISLLSGIGFFLGMLIVCTAILSLIGGMYFVVSNDDVNYSWNRNRDGTVKDSLLNMRKAMKSVLKVSLITFAISSFILIFIPSEKTAYVMVGAYATQKVAENEKVQETGQKVLTIINQKLDTYVEEGIKAAEKAVKKETK